MRWCLSWKGDPRGARLADRHYSRRASSVGAATFSPPGRVVVLLTPDADALWVVSWQRPEFTKHAWGGAWICTLFRNESRARASDLIREAVAATRAVLGAPPWEGLVTFVDPAEVRPKRDPGHTFVLAGFRPSGREPWTRGGLLALRLPPYRMPEACPPVGSTVEMFA